MNSVVQVEVPENHIAMITVLHVNLTGKRFRCDPDSAVLRMYKTSMAEANIFWECRRKPVQRQPLSEGSKFYVSFQSMRSPKSGFRLFFSIYKVSAILQEVEPALDVWNCSVANFVDFKHHFPCDLYPQCIDKEDEGDCPYFSQECGLGFVTLANYCLVYVKVKATGTWRDKEFMCQQRGMRLANFRSREDYNILMQYLKPLTAVWSFRGIAVGIHSASMSLPIIYKSEMQNSDDTIAFYMSIRKVTNVEVVCGMIFENMDVIKLRFCTEKQYGVNALCEISKTTAAKSIPLLKSILHSASHLNHSYLPFLIGCPMRHVTRDFLACDFGSMCWSHDTNSCYAPLTPPPPSFTCTDGMEHVPYTLVCDFRPDCNDGSDENFCVFPSCDLPEPFYCNDIECVPFSTVCDGQQNCFNAFDEDLCSESTKALIDRPSSPSIVHLNQHGQFIVHKMTQSQLAEISPHTCPETHFQCPDDGYCMPVFLRCNGVYDCPGKEDEEGCNGFTCPGFYRCRGSQVCLHPEHLCDRVFQCAQNDDELICDLSCPVNCTCYGLAFYCRHSFPTRSINKLRFLDLRRSKMRISDLTKNIMLIYLSVTESGLITVDDLNFPNLHSLDLTDNNLTEIRFHDLNGVPHLETLFLSGNPLLSIFDFMDIPERTSRMFSSENVNDTFDISKEMNFMRSVRTLDLSRVKVTVLNTSFLSLLPTLHIVNMSGGGVDTLLAEGLQALTQLRALDLRGCPLTHFRLDILRGLGKLEHVHSDNYKLCCPSALPAGFVLKNCHAPPDEISSCSELLGSSYYRIFVSVVMTMTLLGNTSIFVHCVLMKKRLLSFHVFVAHLCVANFFMGVYLSAVRIADYLYQGTYVKNEDAWKNSSVCQMAGLLSLVSTEVSALVICLITVERCLVIGFPFSTFHFGTRSAQVAALCAWIVGCLIATVPLALRAGTMRFYGQTGMCVPLPDVISDFPVALGNLILVNFVFFTVIIAGQVFIYWSVQTNSSSLSETRKKDLAISRRFITIAMSDFLCWFPIGLVAVLVARGTAIPREVNVAMVIFVQPFNSALSPFLYSLNVVLEKQRRVSEERIRKRIMAQFR